MAGPGARRAPGPRLRHRRLRRRSRNVSRKTHVPMAVVAAASTESASRQSLDEWVDRNSGRIMVLPAVLILLAFAIFPLIISVYLSLCRFALAAGSFKLTYIGFYNYRRLLFGVQQYHFLGTLKPLDWTGWVCFVVFLALMLVWLARYIAGNFTVLGLIGRLISASLATGIVLAALETIPAHAYGGTLLTTYFYVAVRRRRAIPARPRSCAALCAADPRAQLVPRHLLHPADGDARRRRLHVSHVRRHGEGAV